MTLDNGRIPGYTVNVSPHNPLTERAPAIGWGSFSKVSKKVSKLFAIL